MERKGEQRRTKEECPIEAILNNQSVNYSTKVTECLPRFHVIPYMRSTVTSVRRKHKRTFFVQTVTVNCSSLCPFLASTETLLVIAS